MKDMPWFTLVLAVLILLFTFWSTAASWWIVVIAAVLIVIKSIWALPMHCKCCDVEPKKSKKK